MSDRNTPEHYAKMRELIQRQSEDNKPFLRWMEKDELYPPIAADNEHERGDTPGGVQPSAERRAIQAPSVGSPTNVKTVVIRIEVAADTDEQAMAIARAWIEHGTPVARALTMFVERERFLL